MTALSDSRRQVSKQMDVFSLPLSEIIFRTHVMSGEEEIACPLCLTYNSLSATTCKNCDYNKISLVKTEDDFWTHRSELIVSDVPKVRIGFGENTAPERGVLLREKVLADLSSWQPIIAAISFLNHYSVIQLTLPNLMRSLIGNSPIKEDIRDSLAKMKSMISIPREDSSLLYLEFLDIQNKMFFPAFEDLTYWARVYVSDDEEKSVRQNLEWLNIAYGYSMQGGNYHPIDEDNFEEVKTSLPYIQTNIVTDYEIELVFFPLHWRFLAYEKLSVHNKSIISRRRYQYLLENYTPFNHEINAWKQMGLYYSTGDSTFLSHPDVVEYLAREKTKAYGNEDYDVNFVFSYALLTGEKIEDELLFPSIFHSYFVPILPYLANPDTIDRFFFQEANRESLIRAIRYFDFSHFPDLAKKLSEKLLSELSEKELSEVCKNPLPGLVSPLLSAALLSGKTQIFLTLLAANNYVLPDQIRLIDLLGKDSAFLKTVVAKSTEMRHIEFEEWQELIFDERLPEGILRDLLANLGQLSFENPGKLDILRYIQEYFRLEHVGESHKANLFFEALGTLVRGSIVLDDSTKQALFNGRFTEFLDYFAKLFDSADMGDREILSGFIERYVDIRGIDIHIFDTLTEPILFWEHLAEFFYHTKNSRASDIAYSLLREAVRLGMVGDEFVVKHWKRVDEIPVEQFREEWRFFLQEKPCIVSLLDAEKDTLINAEKPQAEVLELQKQLEAMKREKAVEEDQRKLIDDAKADAVVESMLIMQKSQEYQRKVAELQVWYQTEMAMLMTQLTDPLERQSKIALLSADFQTKMMVLSQWMSE